MRGLIPALVVIVLVLVILGLLGVGIHVGR